MSTLEENRATFGRWLGGLRRVFLVILGDCNQRNVVATFLTTLSVFGIYLIQGIIVARMLGPVGRGEFGTSLYFPRDILLYAGLLGAVEVVAGVAARGRASLGQQELGQLRFSALRLGLITGILTATVAGLIAVVVLVAIGKSYIIPFCLLICLFVPFEHVHLTVSSVDRGNRQFARYNINRLIFATVFPVFAIVAWQLGIAAWLGISQLLLVCCLFVLSRLVGLAPTLMGWQIGSFFRGEGSRSGSLPTPSARRMLSEGKPYALSMVVSEIFDRLDILLILVLADVATSGQYFVAVPAAALLTVAPNSFGVFTFNAGANKSFVPTLKQVWTALGLTSLLQILATVAMLLAIPFLISFVYGEEFEPAVQFAMWLLPACAIKGLIQAADAYLKGREKPLIGVWSRAISIILMLLFIAMFYRQFGLVSVPMSACFGQAFSMLVIVAALLLDVSKRNRQDPKG